MTTEELCRPDGLLFRMARLGSPTLMLQQLEELSLAHTDWPEDLKSFREKKKHRRRLICERAIEVLSIEKARNQSIAMLMRDDIYESMVHRFPVYDNHDQ